MISKLATFNGTGVNLNGFACTVGALESALNQSWKYGLPSCISHDLHRLFGWSKGMSLFLEPGLVRLAGLIYFPEEANDEEFLQKIFQAKMCDRIQDSFTPYSQELYQRLSKFLSEKHSPLTTDCASLVDSDLAVRAFPNIFEQQDKDGLIPLSILKPIGPGVYEIDGLLLFAHPFFRRSLSRYNSLNAPFLTRFQDVTQSCKLNSRIALDQDMIGLSHTYKEHIELEYWWGPKFTDELVNIDFGVTRHEADKRQKMFHGISATEFWWHNQNSIKTLECEEIRDMPSFGIDRNSFGCRYVHSMLDPIKFIPNHLDGAIRLYDEASMLERLATDISKSGKKSCYCKLWRIDGEINISVWKQLLNDYFRDNRLVGEYLGGEEENEFNTPQELVSTTYSSPLSKFIPCNMESGDGIRISISYDEKTSPSEHPISFIPTDFINSSEGRSSFLEYDSIELAKLLKRDGFSVNLPNDAILIAFEDMLLNFPRVHHSGKKSVEMAMASQSSFLSLCKAWASRGDNRVISFTISIEYNTKDVYFSFAGHVNDLVKWFESKEAVLPISEDHIGKWAEDAANFIDKSFKQSIDSPPLHDLLKKDGMLIFERRFLKDNECRVKYDEGTGSLFGDLMISKEDKDLFEAITLSKVKVASAFLVRNSECSKCHTSYHLCNCSKFIDEGVFQKMTGVSMLGLFWTNRKA
jgi:hypothetical protein